MLEHELTHRAAMVCACGAQLYEDETGVYCSATNEHLPWKETRHSKSCVRDNESGWICVKQCLVHRAQLKLLDA